MKSRKNRGNFFGKLAAVFLAAALTCTMSGFSVLADEDPAGGTSEYAQAEESQETASEEAQTEPETGTISVSEVTGQSSETAQEPESAAGSDSETETRQTAAPDLPRKAPARAAAYDGTTAIYLNGQSGDDAKDGKDASAAVKTFARAKEIAKGNPQITTIYVTGTVPVSGSVSLAGTNAVIKRDPSFSGYLMDVSSSAEFTDITLDGNGDAVLAGKSLVQVTGSLSIGKGTVLKNNYATKDRSYFQSTGGGLTVRGGSVTMIGGQITGNKANIGGGVFVVDKGSFTLAGGSLDHNEAVEGTAAGISGYSAGGGAAAYNGSSITISGGSVSNNTSRDIGGGISIGTNNEGDGHDSLTMTGGTVSGNTSGSCGGIYVNGSGKRGYHNGELKITNVLIKDNTASLQGGGFAGCPSSKTEIYLTDGAALIGNKASGGNGIFLAVGRNYGDHSGNPTYTISPVMLGGTAYNWKYDDGSDIPLSGLKGRLTGNKRFALNTDISEDAAA